MNKVYRAEVVSGIFFPEGRNMMEDGVWTPYVLEKCHRLAIIAQPLYNYYVHQGSVSRRRRRSEPEIVGFYKNLLERDQFVLEHAEQGVGDNTVKKVLKDLETVFDSCCNLALWNTRDTAKDIVKKHYCKLNRVGTKKQALLVNFLYGASEDTEKDYHRILASSSDVGLTDKVKLLRMSQIAWYRRLRERK